MFNDDCDGIAPENEPVASSKYIVILVQTCKKTVLQKKLVQCPGMHRSRMEKKENSGSVFYGQCRKK